MSRIIDRTRVMRAASVRAHLMGGSSATALRAVSAALLISAAGAPAAMAATDIGDQASTYVLTAGGNPYTVGASSSVNVSSGDAIVGDGSATAWSLTNQGAITSASGDGINLGVGAATIVNDGTIQGGDDAVFLAAGGAVTNQAGASISGGSDGVHVRGGVAKVVNAGAIAGGGPSGGFGVALDSGGSVSNLAGGVIQSGVGYAINISGGGDVTNAGAIEGAGGISLDRGSVTNSNVINAAYGAVSIQGAGSVVNTGSITSGASPVNFAHGVQTGDGSSVTNSGSISVGSAPVPWAYGVAVGANSIVTNSGQVVVTGVNAYGVQAGNGLTLVNSGRITAHGTNSFGVSAGNRFDLNNQAGGEISGESAGVLATSGVVTNAGVISAAANGSGLTFQTGGDVTNLAGGRIEGGVHGVSLLGASGSVTNAGTISATNSAPSYIPLNPQYPSAVFLARGGRVTNQAGGTIQSATVGVEILGGYGSLSNQGAISADGAAVVITDGASVVVNSAGGSIQGGRGGVLIGGGAVTNAGTITSTGSFIAAVNMSGNGTISNLAGGAINSDANAVWLHGRGDVTNAGKITSINQTGVMVGAGGSITNQAGGVIAGADLGALIVGNPGVITNAGTITASFSGADAGTPSGAAAMLTGGGSIINQAGGQLIGGNYGAVVTETGDANIVNAGLISGGVYSVLFNGSHSNTLTLQTGGKLVGEAMGSSAVGARNSLVLAGHGQADNLFTNFNSLTVNADGAWVLGGTSAIGATEVATGKLMVTGALTSAFKIDQGATLQGSTATLLAQGDLVNGGTVVFDQAANGTFANAITGSGALIKANTGTLTLTGVSGAASTEVAGGKLVVTGALTSAFQIDQGATLQGSTGALLALGDIVDNGTLVLDQASGGVLANAVKGTGALIKQNSGVLVLSGTSQVASTEVAGGLLAVDGALTSAFQIDSGAGLIGSSTTLLAQGAVTDNGALIFNQDQAGTFANAIKGSGILYKTGADLTLSGTSQVASTEVLDGRLIVTGALTSAFQIDLGATLQGSSTTLLAQGAVIDNGTLVFDQASKGAFANAITGSGALVKQGSGLLALNGVSSVSGGTTVKAGNLQIGDAEHEGARLTSDVVVNKGAILSGHGTVVGNVVNSGVVSPGGSIGTLTVNGDYTQTAGGVLQIEMNPTGASTLQVSGTATLGGTLQVDAQPGVYRTGSQYTFVNANAVSGAFSSVTTTTGYQFATTSSANGLSAKLKTGFATLAGGTQNQTQIAGGVAAYPVGVSDFDPVASVINGLPAGAAQNNALDQLGGEVAADVLSVRRAGVRATLGALSDQLADARAVGGQTRGRNGAWANGFGRFASVGADDGAHGYKSTVAGMVGGVQREIADTSSLGLLISYAHANLDLRGLAQNGSSDGISVGAYGEHRFGALFIDAAATVGYDMSNITRNISLPGASRRAKGDFDGTTIGGLLSVGARLGEPRGVRVEPSLSLAFSRVDQEGFNETGATGADLAVRDQSQNSLQSLLGARFSKAFSLGGGDLLAQADLGWSHELDSTRPTIRQSFIAAPGSDFVLAGARTGTDSAILGASAVWSLSAKVSFYGAYDASIGDRETASAVSIGARFSW